MRFFKNYDEPSVGVDIGRFSLLVWYGSVLQWAWGPTNCRSHQNGYLRFSVGPFTFFRWTY